MPVTFVRCPACGLARAVLAFNRVSRLYFFCPRCQHVWDTPAKPHSTSYSRRFGDYVANEKTNAVGKTDLSECAWVFQSALLSLQKRAHALGANAVINIHSFYKKEDVSSETEIPCHTGFLMAGIALKGDLVAVAGK